MDVRTTSFSTYIPTFPSSQFQPLIISAIKGSVPLVFILLKHGARYDISDRHGWLPLSYALMPLKSVRDANGDVRPASARVMNAAGKKLFQETVDKAENFADLVSTYDRRVVQAIAAAAKIVAATAAAKGDSQRHQREKKHRRDWEETTKRNLFQRKSVVAVNPENVDPGAAASIKEIARDEAIREGRSRSRDARPEQSRYETIAMALLKTEDHLDSAIEDDISLFKESLERHFDLNRADLIHAFFDPTDGYDNELFRDPLLQCAIDLHWTSKVFPSSLWELVKFSCFVIVVCYLGTVEAGQLTPSPRYLVQAFDTIFIGENWDDYGVKEFGDIGNAGELWPWIENVFLGGVYPDPGAWRDTNGMLQTSPFSSTEWVGRPRMRTLESSQETCAYQGTQNSSVMCFGRDLTTAPARWTASVNETQQQHRDGFRWQPPRGGSTSTSDVGLTSGKSRVYPGGGLVVAMPEDKAEAVALVAKLKAGDWINLNTRVFIAEFTAYSANTGMYTVGQIIVEMTDDGMYLPSHSFRVFPRVEYSFSSSSDIFRLVVEVVFLLYFCLVYVAQECMQGGKRWEDPVKEDAVHWKSTETEQNTRKQLKIKLETHKPTLGSILVGNLDFEGERAQGVVNCVRKWGDYVVIRPYFYDPFSYFDVTCIGCLTLAVVLQVAQLYEEKNIEEAENGFVPGYFFIAKIHSARMYLIAFGAFFCWCKVRCRTSLLVHVS